jgi:hypothetical protein
MRCVRGRRGRQARLRPSSCARQHRCDTSFSSAQDSPRVFCLECKLVDGIYRYVDYCARDGLVCNNNSVCLPRVSEVSPAGEPTG